MPYRRSTAKSDFDSRVKALFATAEHVENSNRFRKDVKALVFQGAIFQLSAAIEDYVSANLSSWLYQVGRQGLQCRQMPESVRSYFLSAVHTQSYRRYAFDGDEKQLLRSIALKNLEFQLVIDTNPFPPHLTGQQLAKGRTYPSVKNLEALFVRIGLDTLFNELSRRTRSNAALTLKSFNDVRNTIAHASPPALTYVDVDRHFREIKALIAAMDRVLWSYVNRWSGSSCWV